MIQSMGRDTDYERQSEARRIGAMGPEAAEDVCALPGACYCGARTLCDDCAPGPVDRVRERGDDMREDTKAIEALAARLDEEAHLLRELGRYGQRALGEGEDLVDVLWEISDRLREVEYEIDRIAYRIAEDEVAS